VQRINHCLPASGATEATTCPVTGYHVTKNWSLTLPPNAATVYIEVYPKSATSTDWLNNYQGFTGVAAGSTVLSTYGETYRRAIATPGNMQNIPIVLPVICGLPGASTGSLYGHISGWPSGVDRRQRQLPHRQAAGRPGLRPHRQRHRLLPQRRQLHQRQPVQPEAVADVHLQRLPAEAVQLLT
jgi:hypothetical protein